MDQHESSLKNDRTNPTIPLAGIASIALPGLAFIWMGSVMNWTRMSSMEKHFLLWLPVIVFVAFGIGCGISAVRNKNSLNRTLGTVGLLAGGSYAAFLALTFSFGIF